MSCEPDDIVSALFTVTRDLDAAFPARAAEEFGWNIVALLHATEIPVPGSLPKCIRLLVHAYTSRSRAEIKHCYLRGGHGAPARPRVTVVQGHSPRRGTLGSGPSLDLPERSAERPGRRRPGRGQGLPRDVSSVRPSILPDRRSGSGCWSGPTARSTRPGGWSGSPQAPPAASEHRCHRLSAGPWRR